MKLHFKISAGASRRSRAPLLQFWHHEVTDCSAKTSVQNIEEPNQNHKGFQRDWWDPACCVFHCIYNTFATFAQKCFPWRHRGSACPYPKILGLRLLRWEVRAQVGTQTRSYSEPLVPTLLKDAFVWGWDPVSSLLQRKRGPNPGHARNRFSTFGKKV